MTQEWDLWCLLPYGPLHSRITRVMVVQNIIKFKGTCASFSCLFGTKFFLKFKSYMVQIMLILVWGSQTRTTGPWGLNYMLWLTKLQLHV